MTKLHASGALTSTAFLCAIASCHLNAGNSDTCDDSCSSHQSQHACEAAGCGWLEAGLCGPVYHPGDPCFPTVQVDAGSSVDSSAPCGDIHDAADCLARSDCGATYTGMDCTGSDGSACVASAGDCACASYVFASCQNN